MGTKEHKNKAPKTIQLGIVSVSTTRTLSEDKSGHWIARQALKQGHEVRFHQVIPDDAAVITATVAKIIRDLDLPVVLITGGTGTSHKDVTIEAVQPLFSKELTAFGAIFAQLSFEKIDSAAIMSRATAGVVGKTVVFCMPGSLKACKLACKELIFPELGHLVQHVRKES